LGLIELRKAERQTEGWSMLLVNFFDVNMRFRMSLILKKDAMAWKARSGRPTSVAEAAPPFDEVEDEEEELDDADENGSNFFFVKSSLTNEKFTTGIPSLFAFATSSPSSSSEIKKFTPVSTHEERIS